MPDGRCKWIPSSSRSVRPTRQGAGNSIISICTFCLAPGPSQKQSYSSAQRDLSSRLQNLSVNTARNLSCPACIPCLPTALLPAGQQPCWLSSQCLPVALSPIPELLAFLNQAWHKQVSLVTFCFAIFPFQSCILQTSSHVNGF